MSQTANKSTNAIRSIQRECTTILPPSGWSLPDIRELFAYRDLLWLLTVRNISLVYRQSLLGIGWALIRPLVTTIVFAIVFGQLAGFDGRTPTVPYPVFVLTGLVVWNFFATSLSNTSESVVAQSDMLTKIYFPRLILPLSAINVASVDFLIQVVMLAGVMAFYGVVPQVTAPALLLFFLAAAIVSLAVGIWLTALNVRFRDVKHTVPFLIQTLLYLTPVIYPVGFVPESWRWILHLNPMFGIVQGFRWTLLGTEPPDWTSLSVSLLLTIAILIGGLVFFRRTETTFADVI